jgi:hypothetical protein
MLNHYIDDVITKGGDAVLPQNLAKKWFDTLYAASVHFIRKNLESTSGNLPEKSDTGDAATDKAEEPFDDMGSAMLFASVNELLQYNSNYSPDSPVDKLSEDDLYDCISGYAMSVIFQAISNETGIVIPAPDTKSIFDTERLFDIEASDPVFTRLLTAIISNEAPPVSE